MDIIIHDTVSLFEPHFTSTAHPKQRLADALDTILGEAGFQNRLGKLNAAREQGGYEVMAAVLKEGYNIFYAEQGWGLFNPSRKVAASAWEFARYREVDILAQIRHWLTHFAAAIGDVPALPRVECFLLPSDPGNRRFMAENFGLSTFGGVPGALSIRIWPSVNSLARLGPTLARIFIHNVRWAMAPVAESPTLADLLVTEGLAASFVREQFPQEPLPWLVAFRAPEGWQATLDDVAQAFYDMDSYDEVVGNIYGMAVTADESLLPPSLSPSGALDEEEMLYAGDIIRDALGERLPARIAAYLYGDEIVTAQGYEAMGLPLYAGFEVGDRLVQRYLERADCSLMAAAASASEEILGDS